MTSAFATLKAEIKRDIEARNKSLAGEFWFTLTDNGESFAVHTASERTIKVNVVTFYREGRTLAVKGNDGKEKFNAILTLSPDRKCRFKIDSQEYDFWYIRKMALEDLFFWDS